MRPKSFLLMFLFAAVTGVACSPAQESPTVTPGPQPGVVAVQAATTKVEPSLETCSPELPDQTHSLNLEAFRFRSDEKSVNSPIIALHISEAGDISQVELKRTSGVERLDHLILEGIKGWHYKPQPSCGTREVEMTITIDFYP